MIVAKSDARKEDAPGAMYRGMPHLVSQKPKWALYQTNIHLTTTTKNCKNNPYQMNN